MPFTPFHFGPGAIIKALIPKYFSFPVFVFANVVIDLEPLYFMWMGEAHVHRFSHTYLGATLIALLSFFLGRPLCSWALTHWNQGLTPTQAHWLHISSRIDFWPAVVGSTLGAYSHVFLDSVMHADIRPLAPFMSGNALLSLISLSHLHWLCLYLGVLGMMILLIRRAKTALGQK